MDVRTFPVLTDEDEALVARLSIGVGENAARVLAYLVCRLADPDLSDAATRTAVHIGAGVSKNAATDALTYLVSAGLIAETTATTAAPGRPPKAWHAVVPEAETIRRADERHAVRLLEQGERYAGREGTTAESDRADGDSGGDGSATTRPTADDSARERVSVALNWRPNGLHLPLLAAQSSDAGDVSLVLEAYDGSAAATDAVASGACDVAVAGAATVLRARARGLSVVPIAVPYQRSTVVLYTTRAAFGGPLETVEGLRGRRIGMPAGSETGLLGRLLLEQAGIREHVELVDVDGEERAALRSGAVDAVTGMVSDPARLESSGRTVEVLAVADAYPAYGPSLIVETDALRSERGRFEAVLVAAMAGWAKAEDATAATAESVADETDESAERIARTFDRATEEFGPSDAVRRCGWGWHSPEKWRNLRAALAQGGLLEAE